MIEIRAEGPQILLRKAGPITTQLSEFASAFHAWAQSVAETQVFRDALRDVFVDRITDDDVWHVKPDKVEEYIEVDSPEDLFDQGGD